MRLYLSSTDIEHVSEMSLFCSIPVCLTTPVACCSDSLCSPTANYVSGKQDKQAGTAVQQTYGNMPCFTGVVMVFLWIVFVRQSFCMLCKY